MAGLHVLGGGLYPLCKSAFRVGWDHKSYIIILIVDHQAGFRELVDKVFLRLCHKETKMPYLHSKKGFISPAMIGRSSELEHLLDRFARVQDRQGQCVLITGEAGVGKSRFIFSPARESV